MVTNSSPLDAHVAWHVLLARRPTLPEWEVEVIMKQAEEGEVDEHGDPRHVIVTVQTPTLRGPPHRPPFKVIPSRGVIPAQGKCIFTVRAAPTPATAKEQEAEAHLGWEEADGRNGLLVADAVFVPRKSKPEQALLDLIADENGPLDAKPGAGTEGAEEEEEESRRRAGQEAPTTPGPGAFGASATGPRPASPPAAPTGSGATAGTGGVQAAQIVRSLVQRNAVHLAAKVEPSVPELSVDKSISERGLPWFKLTAWATREMDHPEHRKTVTLTNNMTAAVTFARWTRGPFRIFGVQSSVARAPPPASDVTPELRAMQEAGHDIMTLPPGTSIAVEVAFAPETDKMTRTTGTAALPAGRAISQAKAAMRGGGGGGGAIGEDTALLLGTADFE